MRNRFVTLLMLVLVYGISLSLAGVVRAQQGEKERARQTLEADKGSQDFDPHDFSGIWEMIRLDHTLGTVPPALTPAGLAAIKGRIGDTPGVPREIVQLARQPNSYLKLAGNGVRSNAPWLQCNPQGFPRLMNDDEPFEFIMTKDKVLQVFQWEHRIRYLWTDGRAVPSGQNLEDLGPSWYGHSVANWEGNTLVVNTVGLDDRGWLDSVGHPKSFHARIEERWRLIDSKTLEVQESIYDPEYYTAPYIGSKKMLKKLPDTSTTYFGWKGLMAGITEGICAPMNESKYHDEFHQNEN
jgi:hypothetical protein